MKVAVLGGAGTRVPLVVLGLLRAHEELATQEVALWDVNRDRELLIARICQALAERYGIPLRIYPAGSVEAALEGAQFAICSIRVGGGAGRVADENIALAHGTLGQETVGPGGWAMALRTIPPVIEYAQALERLAPRAWLINFTNPVGIVQQALVAAGCTRVIGVCDTPRELFELVARELRLESQRAFFDYFGLNHLGWLRHVLVDGRDILQPLFARGDRLPRFYRSPLFDGAFLQELRLLPTEYLYFYYRTNQAMEKIREQGTTRGQMVAEQEKELFSRLGRNGNNPTKMLQDYEAYLARRESTYFRLETGGAVSVQEQEVEQARRELYERAAGYERIAMDVIRAIHTNQRAVMPVDVENQGSIDDLEAQDAVEVPCVLDANGARPLAVGTVPAPVRPLLLQVKHYERLTVQATREGSFARAVEALAANPLIPSRTLAEKLAHEYKAAHRPWLDYLH